MVEEYNGEMSRVKISLIQATEKHDERSGTVCEKVLNTIAIIYLLQVV